MAHSPQVIEFLTKLFERNAPNSYTMKDHIVAAIGGKESSTSRIWVKDEFAELAMHILSSAGAESREEKLEWICKACACAMTASKDRDAEFNKQFTDMLSIMLTDDIDDEAEEEIEPEFVPTGKHCTFHNKDYYPAQIEGPAGKYRLMSASYKKGTYQIIREKVAETPPPDITDVPALVKANQDLMELSGPYV